MTAPKVGLWEAVEALAGRVRIWQATFRDQDYLEADIALGRVDSELQQMLATQPTPVPGVAETVQHDHSGPDWNCLACKPLADVLRDRMRWPSLHWGDLHSDAWPSLARAVMESDWLRAHVATEVARALGGAS